MCYGHDRGTVINVPTSYFSQSMQTKRYLLNGQTYIIVDRVTTDRTVRPFSQFKQVFFGLFTFTITELGKTNSISRNLEANLINTSLKIRLHEAIRFLVFYQWNLMGLFFCTFGVKGIYCMNTLLYAIKSSIRNKFLLDLIRIVQTGCIL